jgi:hypothetical protein
MKYCITWKHNGQVYTEYGDLKKMTEICEFLENHNGYDLIKITWDED